MTVRRVEKAFKPLGFIVGTAESSMSTTEFGELLWSKFCVVLRYLGPVKKRKARR